MADLDLSPYGGRWVALAQGQVAGVGFSPEEARRLGQRNRPKERLALRFVEAPGGEMLVWPALLAEIRPLLSGQEEPVFLVGGAVRDALLGRPGKDLDFVTSRHAIRLAYQVGDALHAPAYVLDKSRDTGRVVLPDGGVTLDFARFRGVDLNEDLRDRDFTVNAMAVPATAQTTAGLIDPCGGLADLQAGHLRLTHPGALQKDPVRALRAVRLALEIGLTMLPETETAVSAAAPLLTQISTERVRDELLKLLQTAVPHRAVAMLHQFGLLAVALPEVAALADVAQSPPHHEPVLAHTISVLRWLVEVETAVFNQTPPLNPALLPVYQALAPFSPDLTAHFKRTVEGGLDGHLLLRLAALFHDVGKKRTQSTAEDGRIRFLGHDQVGAELASQVLHHLALSNKAVEHVVFTVRGHMRPLLLLESQGAQPSRRAVYRYFRDIKSAGLDVGLLSLADHLATYDGPGTEQVWQRLVALVAELFRFYFERYEETVAPVPLLNGRDLMQILNLPPGPEIGRLLRLLEEAQAAGQLASREEALAFARQAAGG